VGCIRRRLLSIHCVYEFSQLSSDPYALSRPNMMLYLHCVKHLFQNKDIFNYTFNFVVTYLTWNNNVLLLLQIQWFMSFWLTLSQILYFCCLHIFQFVTYFKAVTCVVLLYMLQLTSGHRTVILSAMEKIIRQKMDEIDVDLTLDTIKQASVELTMSKVTVCYFLFLVMCLVVNVVGQH